MCLGHAGSTELTAGHDRAQIKRPSGGGVSGFFSRERFFFRIEKMPRASAKAKASAASNEEQELIRLRKELMEKQATLKRALAAGKRQKTEGGAAVRVLGPRRFGL